MRVTSEFLTSAAGPEGFPRESLPELAMVGRSNVGKSSLINALVRQAIARTSAAPGKTRLANFFRITADGVPPFCLVDLPGYGYARGGDKARETFDELAAGYFARASRSPTHTVLLLVDSRHPELEPDRRAYAWLDGQQVACHVVATKLDKLSQAERRRHLAELERRYSGSVTAVSAHTGEGLDTLWTLIARLLRQLPPADPRRPNPSPSTSRPSKN